MGGRKMPEVKDLVNYNQAVAGHEGTLCDPDGELFVKPCTQEEIDFYETAENEHPEFYRWMPRHWGTLRLTDATDIADVNVQLGPEVAELMSEHMKEEVVEYAHHPPKKSAKETPACSDPSTPWEEGRNRKIKTNLSIVLDNAAYGYKEANIMDCKLGFRLWADDARQEKKDRFDKIANTTTHLTHGFRVAGMRTYKGSEDPSELDPEGYRKYNKDWGRETVNSDNIVESMRHFIFNRAAGVRDEDARFVCELFVNDLIEVEKMLTREESRMYSASLLFVAEGDGEALALAIREARAAAAEAAEAERIEGGSGRARKAAKTCAGSCPSWSSNHRVDSGIGMDDCSHDEFSDADSDDSDAEFEGGARKRKSQKIYSLRLIDFAHAEWVPGQGPDENVLKGVRSLISIFRDLADWPVETNASAPKPAANRVAIEVAA